MYSKYVAPITADERGQTTIALVGVLAVGVAAMVALSVISQAMVHRVHARNAADATALATAVDPHAGAVLHDWYLGRGVSIEQHGEQTLAASGPSRAAAWASVKPSSTQPAPALVAIIARAEQLQQTAIDPVGWEDVSVALSTTDARTFRRWAAELGVCETVSQDDAVIFELC